MKLRLEDDFVTPATIFGIISDLPDHRLCYVLNQELGLKLTRCEKDKELQLKKKGILHFSEFCYHAPAEMTEWWLTSNRHALIYPNDNTQAQVTALPLIADLKTMNYFLWYTDEARDELNDLVKSKLQKNRYIRAVIEIDRSASKNIENLLVEY